MTPEGQLKHDVMNALDDRGVFYMRMQSGVIKKGSRFIHLHKTGTSDLLIFPHGRVLWCELKAPGQKTAKDRIAKQTEFRDKVLSAGHEHLTAYSVEDVLKAVESVEK